MYYLTLMSKLELQNKYKVGKAVHGGNSDVECGAVWLCVCTACEQLGRRSYHIDGHNRWRHALIHAHAISPTNSDVKS